MLPSAPAAYKVRNPTGLKQVVASALLFAVPVYSLLQRSHYTIFDYLFAVYIPFMIGYLIFNVIQWLKKPSTLELHGDYLILNGKRVEAKAIRRIMIRGYFRPIVGILPEGKRIVPFPLSFRFLEQEDDAFKALGAFAEMNEMKLERRNFIRWA